ncbi:MAG: ATP-binding cassette domain-containing protein [Pontiella sp.]
MLEFNDITLQVHQQLLLEQVSLQMATGDKVVICGPSGSGKSSLLKATVGALPLSGGKVRVEGKELSAQTVAEIRAGIAFIGQEPELCAERVHEALLLPFKFKTHRHNTPNKYQILEYLERLQLPEAILNKPCNRISGGEKQRIVIIRALLLGKSIFLADEVTSALDPESRATVMTELFRPEITLLSVSHDPEWICACSRLVEFSNHQLVEAGK